MVHSRGDNLYTNFASSAPYKIWEGKKRPKFSTICKTFDFDRKYLRNGSTSLENRFIPYWANKFGKLWSTNQKVIGAHVDPPNWTVFVILYFGPYAALAPQIFTRPTSPINCISSRAWGAGRPQVGLCPIFRPPGTLVPEGLMF